MTTRTWTTADYLRDASAQQQEHDDAMAAEARDWDRDDDCGIDVPSRSELAADAWADRMEGLL